MSGALCLSLLSSPLEHRRGAELGACPLFAPVRMGARAASSSAEGGEMARRNPDRGGRLVFLRLSGETPFGFSFAPVPEKTGRPGTSGGHQSPSFHLDSHDGPSGGVCTEKNSGASLDGRSPGSLVSKPLFPPRSPGKMEGASGGTAGPGWRRRLGHGDSPWSGPARRIAPAAGVAHRQRL